MKIPIDKELKIELLKSLKRGYIDTDNIEVLKTGFIIEGTPLHKMRQIFGIDSEEKIEN